MVNVIIAIILIVWLAILPLIVFAVNKKQTDKVVDFIVEICDEYLKREIIDSYFITNNEIYMLTLSGDMMGKKFQNRELITLDSLKKYINKFKAEFKNGNVIEFDTSKLKEFIDWR